MNNVDVIILFVVGISGLIALSRGLVKEVLSIIGWVLGTIAVIYLLPILNPLTEEYIAEGMIGGIITALSILIVFMIIWNISTSGIINDIRISKMSSLDRILGLFFGIARAFLLIVLVYILLSWIMPHDKQPEVLQESKYFNIAGNFAKPIEDLIPESTLQIIRDKTRQVGDEAEKKQQEIKEKQKTAIKEKVSDDSEELFNRLAQPKVKAHKKEQPSESKKEDTHGYKESERDNLDRLIENIE